MIKLRLLLPVLAVGLLWVPPARGDTVRAHVTFTPAVLGHDFTAGITVLDEEGNFLSSREPISPTIPRASVDGSVDNFTLIDHDQPSVRGFCVEYSYTAPIGEGLLRPVFATASEAETGTVNATVTDPDGRSRTSSSTFTLFHDTLTAEVTTPEGITCSGEPSGCQEALQGTSGADKLNGTPGADCINGEDGNDRLDGKGGEDVVDGGAGNDYVVGGAGRDVLKGGAGRDLLSDGLGANTYDAGPGDDVVSARQSIGEQIDCGEGKDLAIVDRKDRVVNCERVERPLGHARGRPTSARGHRSKRASASAIHWPEISAGWWHLPSDASENWAHRKTSQNPYGMTCFAGEESMLAGLVGAWNGGSGSQRRIEFQFRWIDVSPAQFASLAWWQRIGQAVQSPEHKSPWTGMRQFYSTYNWRQRLPAGASRWIQYRIKWVINARHDKVNKTAWLTMGECDGA